MAEPKHGVIDGIEWSETESRKVLYEFARDLGLEVTRKTKKAQIVDILVAASDKNAPVPDVQTAVSPEAVDEVLASNPPPWNPPTPIVSEPVSGAEQWRRQVEARRRKR